MLPHRPATSPLAVSPAWKWLRLPVKRTNKGAVVQREPETEALQRAAILDFATLRMTAVRLASDLPVRLRLNLVKFLLVYVCCLGFNVLIAKQLVFSAFNLYLSLAWASYFPLAVVGLLGAIGSRRLQIVPFKGMISERIIFLIPTVARHDTVPALMRVIDSILLCAPHHLLTYDIHLVTEEGAEGLATLSEQYHGHQRVRFLVVPATYQTRRGTKYKARANQFALDYRRARGLNGRDVFIYHGDDDTAIGPDTIWSIASFITHKSQTADLAQGVLTYPHQLSRSWFCKLADSVRPADDLTRFHFFTGMLGSPLAGLHGEHLLVRASTEEAIGWDFGEQVKVEDAYFGLFFALWFPRRATFLESCSYGASPASPADLVKQRRRWAAGLFGLLCDRRVPLRVKCSLCYSIANWTSGLFQHVGIVLMVGFLLGSFNTSPVFAWILAIWCFSLAYQTWMYCEGLRINLDASQARRWKYYVLPWLVVALLPLFSLVEAWAAVLGLLDFVRKKPGFDVIAKRI